MTTQLATDYLVVGAGATALAFVDTLLDETDDDIIIIDRYDKPGGHWRVAYDHVRLHQPSDFYGVNSRPMGTGHVETRGHNKGLLELATADEIRDYFEKVMSEKFLGSGRVRYLPNTVYLGDGRARGVLSGEEIEIKARKRTVDSTHSKVSVPAMTPPPFAFNGVDVVPPNGLVRIGQGYNRYVVVGGGKTGIDAALWLLDRGVSPDRITWVVPRDAWLFNREVCQPGEQFIEMTDGYANALFGSWLGSESMDELYDKLIETGYFFRLSDDVRPTAFRCATVTRSEHEAIRRISDVVRLGRVLEIDPAGITLENGRREMEPGALYVDCTANGLAHLDTVPVFSEGLITLQSVVFCQQVYSAAFIAHIEARFSDDATKNEYTAAVAHPADEADFLRAYLALFHSELIWSRDPEIVQWRQDARLSGLTTRVGTPLPPAGPDREAALEGFRGLVETLIGKTEELLSKADSSSKVTVNV
ncbi:hypothetical protein [Paenarthrobacter nicotinovorans]|uniref:hypothetical protein n=1 Tax=Paenarthrobacter nicotinovorans TaxID=29320 RepID=UPI00047EB6B3|nr:hypothetical protein [Paenarthrobacter nicotinovorans]